MFMLALVVRRAEAMVTPRRLGYEMCTQESSLDVRQDTKIPWQKFPAEDAILRILSIAM